VIHNFNADGFDARYPKYRAGRPRRFTIWRNKHATDERRRRIVSRANVA
jgi:hypothetical protein